MRSILALFIIAALGFAIILKKDAPESATPPVSKKPAEHVGIPSKHSWVNHPLDQTSALGHVAVNERER